MTCSVSDIWVAWAIAGIVLVLVGLMLVVSNLTRSGSGSH